MKRRELLKGTLSGEGRDEQEVVILLHDFSFSSPDELLAGLTGGGAAPMQHGGMAMPSSESVPAMDNAAAAVDLNDIEYYAYLANDRSLPSGFGGSASRCCLQ